MKKCCLTIIVYSSLSIVVQGLERVVLNVSARPSIVIAGVDKGGTSDAWYLLTRYALQSKGTKKELGCLLASSPERCYQALLKTSIDATPSYMYGWIRGIDTAAALRVVSPTSIVLFLLREPIARLKSLFNHWSQDPAVSRRIGTRLSDHLATELNFLKEKKHAFDQFLFASEKNAMSTYRSLSRNLSLYAAKDTRTCDKIRDSLARIQNSCPVFICFLLISCYVPFLRHWLSYFPGRILLVQSEAYFSNRNLLFDRLYLGSYQQHKAIRFPVVNQGQYRKNETSALSMATERVILQDIIRPANAELLAFMRQKSQVIVLVPPLPDSPPSSSSSCLSASAPAAEVSLPWSWLSCSL